MVRCPTFIFTEVIAELYKLVQLAGLSPIANATLLLLPLDKTEARDIEDRMAISAKVAALLLVDALPFAVKWAFLL